MNDPIQNRLNMIGACVTFANDADNLAIWQNQPPLDLTADMATLVILHTAASDIATQLAGAITGVAESKDAAETALENLSHLLARAVFNHCRKTGDMETGGRVNLSKSAIQRLRDQDLLATTRDIRDAAQAKSTETGAAGRGITTAAIDAFASLINAPRSNIATRAALNRELTTRVAACMDHIRSMDDLVIQLTGASAPDFISGWQQARIIVDAGVGLGEDAPTPPTPPRRRRRFVCQPPDPAKPGSHPWDRRTETEECIPSFFCPHSPVFKIVAAVSCLLFPVS